TIYPQEMRNYALDDGTFQNIRLLDDAFTKICDMVNDRSVKVRSKGDLDVESAELRILKSSACGAFIHGLEDAYQDVRNAAIDMFQDEIDFVRLNSINSLCKIGAQYPIELDSELLQITLSVLNDADPRVR
ncbi:16224_t:CDS:2, partial [Racocetra fulgida]